MESRYFAILVFLLGLLLLFQSLHVFEFNLFLIITMFVSIIVIIITFTRTKLGYKIRRIVVRSIISNSVNRIEINGKEVAYIAFKIVGKEADQTVDYNKELSQVIETIKRHKDRKIKIAVITYLDPIPGSGFIFYQEINSNFNEEEFINNVISLKNIIESIAPHITLEVTNFDTSIYFPFPKIGSAVVFNGYVFHKRYDIPESEILDAKFDIQLGKLIDNYEIPIGINSADVFRHIAIFGATGSGKTNTAALIAKELFKKGFNVVILDWHGEYKELLPEFKYYSSYTFPTLNLFQFDDNELDEVIEIMKDSLELTDPQTFLLYLILEKLKGIDELSTSTLRSVLEQISSESYMIRDIKFALGRKLYLLTTPLGRKLFSPYGYTFYEIGDKLEGGNIIDLSFIKNNMLKRLYSLFLMKFLFEYYEKFKDEGKKIMIVVEEAHNYFNGKNSVLKTALQEIRKYNVSLCIVTQSPSSIDDTVMKNTSIKIIHSIKSNIDKKVISEALSLDKSIIQWLDKFDIGEALLVAPNIRKHAIIKIKKVV